LKKIIERIRLTENGFNIADQFVDLNKLIALPSKTRKDAKIGFVDANKTKTKPIY